VKHVKHQQNFLINEDFFIETWFLQTFSFFFCINYYMNSKSEIFWR